MEKKLVFVITVLVIFIGLPYVVYNLYISHEDGIYRTLKEYDSYTTVDKQYDIKVMKYASLSGEERFNFKFYVIKNDTGEAFFVKNSRISAYGVDIKFNEKIHDQVEVVLDSSSGGSKFVIDCPQTRIQGQKIRAVY